MQQEPGAVKVTKENFDTLINSDQPVLVDFFATWCGPCQMMLPVIEDLGKEQKEHGFAVATLDIDQNPEIAAKYGVMSVPSFLVFKNGQEVGRMLGAMPKEMVISKVKELSN